MNEFTWTTKAGIEVYGCIWDAPEPPVAVIILSHGLGEHIGRYAHVAAFFNTNKMAVIGCDHHGHGKTSGKKGHASSFEVFYEEIEHLREVAAQKYLGVPVFLYGHSMGALIMLSYLVEKQPKGIQGMISSAAAIRLAFTPPALLVAIGKITRSIIPGFTQNNQVNAEAVSRDKAVVEAYKVDPLNNNKLSSALGIGVLEKGDMLYKYKGTIPCPILLMHGNADQLTAVDGSVTFAKQVKGDTEMVIWDGLYHEIHNEPEKGDVLQRAAQWISYKL